MATPLSLAMLLSLLLLLSSTLVSVSAFRHSSLPFHQQIQQRAHIHARTRAHNQSGKSQLNMASSQLFYPESYTSEHVNSASTYTATSHSDKRWNIHYQQLIDYQRRHGHLCVPQLNHASTKDQSLANFCRNVRSQYRVMQEKHSTKDKQERTHSTASTSTATTNAPLLTQYRIRQLESIGFIWNIHDAVWHKHFEELREFYQTHGHCQVPASEDRTLAAWVIAQRRKYKRLLQQRQYQHVKQVPQTSDCTIKSSTHSKTKRFELIKVKGKDLTTRQINLLNSLNFCWNPRDQAWWSMYQELRRFKQEHGHVRIPRHYPQNPKLPAWVAHLRRYCREFVVSHVMEKGNYASVRVSGLDETRLEALRQIQFCWLPHPDRPHEAVPEDIFYMETGETEQIMAD
jgi:Helicase associated domain